MAADSNDDRLLDIVFTMKFGELISAEKYYEGNQTEPSKIGKIEYKFGYPISAEQIRVAEIGIGEFSAIAMEDPGNL